LYNKAGGLSKSLVNQLATDTVESGISYQQATHGQIIKHRQFKGEDPEEVHCCTQLTTNAMNNFSGSLNSGGLLLKKSGTLFCMSLVFNKAKVPYQIQQLPPMSHPSCFFPPALIFVKQFPACQLLRKQ
jgi:hypothetical protein